MRTFLLTWSKWPWPDLADAIALTSSGQPHYATWSVQAHKQIRPGDRVFLMRLGANPRGILASGRVIGGPRLLPHWDPAKKGKLVPKVDVEFEHILDPQHALPLDHLKTGELGAVHWTPQGSGVEIPVAAAAELESVWADWLQHPQEQESGADWTPDELEAIVADYFDMLAAELRGEPYNKTVHRKALLEDLHGRSEASVEFKHRNISAVMAESALPYIAGYRPASNYQDALADSVEAFITSHPEWSERAEAVVPSTVLKAEEYRIEDVLVPPPSGAGNPGNGAHPPHGTKKDYAASNAANTTLGKAGETFVLELEKRYLYEHGRDDLAALVEHVSETQGDGLGYDIRSFDHHGNEKWIEVKTTNLGPRTPFYVSANEADVSCKEAKRYWLYRLYQFSRAPRLFRMQGALASNCVMEPAVFVARAGKQAERDRNRRTLGRVARIPSR